jgi:hypothetical protein
MQKGWIVFTAIIFFSCKKDHNHIAEKKSTRELLTQHQWINSEQGFDNNGNGVIEPDESFLIDCEKNNTYVFNTNGTGFVVDNPIVCAPPLSSDFIWTLTNDNQKIVINQQPLFIVRISKDELLLKADLQGVTTDLLLLYHN